MPIPREGYAGQIPYLQLDRWERERQLSIIRERCRQLGQELFELCCELPRRFDDKGFAEALVLAHELRALRGREDRLLQLEKAEHRNAFSPQ